MERRNVNEHTKFWRDESLGNLELLRATYVTHTFKQHFHEEYAIGVVEGGAFHLITDNDHVVLEGQVIVINPREIHKGHAFQKAVWTYRMLYPGVTLMRQIASEIRGEQWAFPYFPDTVINDPELAVLIQRLHQTLENPALRAACEPLFRLALGQLIARYAINKPTPPSLENERDAVRKVREYLEARYSEHPTLAVLSTVAGLSPYHLVRVFKRQVGIPPHMYLTHIRIDRAKMLLAAGMPIIEVAMATGFSDQSHLNRQFKPIVGVSPGKYVANA